MNNVKTSLKKCFDDNYHSTTFINSFVVLYSINFSQEENPWLVCFKFDSLEEEPTYVFFRILSFQQNPTSSHFLLPSHTYNHENTQAKNIHAPSTSFRSPENYQKLLKSIIWEVAMYSTYGYQYTNLYQLPKTQIFIISAKLIVLPIFYPLCIIGIYIYIYIWHKCH